ncbi:MAG: ankyrin repeat domain-containing protein, partial [Acidobacteriota bacterium]
GADPNTPAANAMRVTVLHAAAAHRDPETALEMVRLLLDRGARPNARQHGGWTPLHQAAAHGSSEMARALLDHGADPNAAADDGSTPATVAARGGHDALAAEILSARASG